MAAAEPFRPSAALVARAEELRRLHAGPGVLVLANAWDVVSARLFAGVPAVRALGTTSAGVAAAAGRPDGEALSRGEALAAAARICAAVDLPVSVDFEGGYADSPEGVAAGIVGVLRAGGVGVNLEDGGAPGGALLPAERHAATIAAARAAADGAAVPLVVNARTDTYLKQVGDGAGRFAETVRRLRAYRAAGADCLFVPGFPAAAPEGSAAPDAGEAAEAAEREIARLIEAVDGFPVNLLASPALPPVARLAELGVRRVSLGSAPFRAALAAARDVVTGLTADGPAAALAGSTRLPYPELARLLADR